MATSFVVQKGVVKMLPQVLKFLFHAPKWKVLINCLHIWNEVLSRVDNHLKAIKLRKVSLQLLKVSDLFLKEQRKFIPNIDSLQFLISTFFIHWSLMSMCKSY